MIFFLYVYLLHLNPSVPNLDFDDEEGEPAPTEDPYFLDKTEQQ